MFPAIHSGASERIHLSKAESAYSWSADPYHVGPGTDARSDSRCLMLRKDSRTSRSSLVGEAPKLIVRRRSGLP